MKITLEISDKLYNAVNRAARKKGITVDELLLMLMEEVAAANDAKKKEPPNNDAFLQEGC